MGKEAKKEKRARRGPYESDNRVKKTIELRSRGICEVCGQKKASEFHHIIAIAIALMRGLDPRQINTPQNAKHVCHSCHQMID